MTLYLLKIVKWLLGKSVALAIAVGIAVGAFAAYQYLGDSIHLERERQERLANSYAERKRITEELGASLDELLQIGREIEVARQRLTAANELIERLEGLLSKIEYLFSTAEEKAAVDRQLADARTDKDRLGPMIDSLVGRESELRISRATLNEQALILEESIEKLEKSSSELARYIHDSWLRLKPFIPIAIVAILLGPIALKGCAYYCVAPLFQRARPIRFAKESLEMLSALDGGVSVALRLGGREKAWIKESYLQASDEHLTRKDRFVLDWKIPVTCLAAGLVELIEIAPEDAESSGGITASTQDKADIELSLIDVPEGGRLILRPSHLVGLVSTTGEAARIRRRWSFTRAQAWMTLQFRFFEFVGPCRLVVSGVRGVRVETLQTEQIAGRRANQDSTIGFTPDLEFGAVRAETFWAYFRGFNPLFDDVFKGKGAFLCQEISKGEGTGPRRFWAGLRDAVLKIVGV